jgi:hypothetical protein
MFFSSLNAFLAQHSRTGEHGHSLARMLRQAAHRLTHLFKTSISLHGMGNGILIEEKIALIQYKSKSADVSLYSERH